MGIFIHPLSRWFSSNLLESWANWGWSQFLLTFHSCGRINCTHWGPPDRFVIQCEFFHLPLLVSHKCRLWGHLKLSWQLQSALTPFRKILMICEMGFKKKMQHIKITHTKLRGGFNIVWHARSLQSNRSVFWKPVIFVWQVVGENVFSRILLLLLPLPKALVHCFLFIQHF